MKHKDKMYNRLLCSLMRLSNAASCVSGRQHANLEVPPQIWSELYFATNEARGIIEDGIKATE